ncbi:MAG: ADP-ribosylglycohydrolase family protein [Chloroflexi bacterium]|nr:ADP-ribosylglycohydrolase family protein [Chloroflexota bacterium]MCY3936848.1 ADP-ribosylglycohydrolase family protein [Chloroflexota bacterium]
MTNQIEPTNFALDRFRGALVGLSVGDALGTTLEFQRPGTFEPISDMTGGGPFGLAPGQWTDDTSLALCLADSLVQRQRFDPRDQIERYARWRREGLWSSTGHCFDIGNTTSAALDRFELTGEPYSGPSHERSAGNGSVMRLAPVPMFFTRDAADAVHYSGQSSRTTHGASACIDACRYFGGLIWAAINGVGKPGILTSNYSPAGQWDDLGPWHAEIEDVAGGSFKRKEPPAIQGSGYVVKSIEAALWAFHKSTSFEQGALMAVNLGDDADTTGAIYGQLAGAFYGIDAIPAKWRGRIALRDDIISLADRLFALAAGRGR